MKSSSSLDWPTIRSRASAFPEEAFEFVREGLRHTVETLHGVGGEADSGRGTDESRHISGPQLCNGLRDFALQRYGLLAGLVLGRWGVKTTDDFGVIVYSLIDRKELRASDRDSIEDFKQVYEFGEAFAGAAIC